MADAPTPVKNPKLEARLAGIESRLADLDPREAMTKLSAQLAHVETLLLELRADVPRLTAQARQPLDPAAVEKLLDEKPHTEFIALVGDKNTGLRAGDRFDSAKRFPNRQNFVSNLRRGLRVAAA